MALLNQGKCICITNFKTFKRDQLYTWQKILDESGSFFRVYRNDLSLDFQVIEKNKFDLFFKKIILRKKQTNERMINQW